MKNELLQQARLDRRWTITEAAKRVRVSRLTYSRWEKGEQMPHDTTLLMACEVFKMTPDRLGFVKEASSPKSVESPEGHTLSPMEAFVPKALLDVHGVLALLWQTYSGTFQEFRIRVEETMDKLYQTSDESTISRRDMLALLVGLPTAIGFTLFKSTGDHDPREVLPIYMASIPASWNLFFEGGWRQVAETLPTAVNHLLPLAQSPTPHQKSAAGLLSQVYQLSSLVAKEEENFGAAITFCRQALTYAQIAGDTNLEVASLLRRLDVLFYRKLPSLDTNQRAMELIKGASPLLQSRLYADMASTIAKSEKQEALRYIGIAHDTFPTDFTNDPGYSYTHTTRYITYLCETLTHMRLGDPTRAFHAMSLAEKYVPEEVSSRRLELVKHLALVSVLANDMERSLAHLDTMQSISAQLGSSLWQTELLDVYQQMRIKWPQEKAIKSLAGMLRADEAL